MSSSPRVLALVMAGGPGSRLELLTARRAKPAMPYGGVYRLIDFPLSNCMHSQLEDVWVIQQYQPHSLSDHISNGRPWDLDRTHGGLLLLHPHQGDEESGWHRGNADAIWRHKSFIEEFDADLLVVLSSDHVYKLDYANVVATHLDADADLTVVTTRASRAEAPRFGVVEVGRDGRVRDFAYKPDEPSSDIVTTEVFVFDAAAALEMLDEMAAQSEGSDDENDPLKDFGDGLVPRLVSAGRAVEHRLDSYWRDLGTVESYWASHMDLLGAEPAIRLDDPSWPIHTRALQRRPAHVGASAAIDDSLISPACEIAGEVVRSVLGPGVVVERGARVSDSVILHEARVGARAQLDLAIVDVEATIGDGGTIGRARAGRAAADITADDIVIVGERACVADGAGLDAGGRVDPGD